MKGRVAAVAFSLCTLLLLPAGAAHADRPTSDQKAAAQALFEQGRDLAEQGHFAEACPKLAESQKLDPGLGSLLWLADCLENNGQTASAWATFSEAASTAAVAHDKREQVARDRVKKLVDRLSRLTILVPQEAAAQGLVVERDGVALGAAEWGLAVPLDPGIHTVGARAPGRKSWSTTVQLPSSPETLQVTVPLLDPAETAPPSPAPATPAPVAAPSEATSNTADTTRGNRQRVIGLALGGLGIVGLGIGTYFSLHAKSTYDGAATGGHCQADNHCDATGTQQRNDAYSQATIATVALGVGAAAVAGGAALYFLAPHAEPVAVGFLPSPRGASASLSVRW